MTVENPYQPPTYGFVSKAVERRIAEQQQAEAEAEAGEKAEPKPANKSAAKPKNKAA